MLGLFSTTKKRVACAYCESEFTVQIPKDPKPKPVEFSVKLDELARTPCPKCGREQVVVRTVADAIDVCDVAWENRRVKLSNYVADIETKIAALTEKRRLLEIDPQTFQAKLGPLEEALRKGRARLRKEDAAYEAQRAAAAEDAAKA